MSAVGTKDAPGAAGKKAQKKAKVPKTVLEKLAASIIALDSPQEGGSSRQVGRAERCTRRQCQCRWPGDGMYTGDGRRGDGRRGDGETGRRVHPLSMSMSMACPL